MCSVAQLYLTICDPLDYSLRGSSVHGIFQAGILEWLPFPSSGNLPEEDLLNLREVSALCRKGPKKQVSPWKGREGVGFSVDTQSSIRVICIAAKRKHPDRRQRGSQSL